MNGTVIGDARFDDLGCCAIIGEDTAPIIGKVIRNDAIFNLDYASPKNAATDKDTTSVDPLVIGDVTAIDQPEYSVNIDTPTKKVFPFLTVTLFNVRLPLRWTRKIRNSDLPCDASR